MRLGSRFNENDVEKNTVLVVGGTAYIGTHMERRLQDKRLMFLVLEDLSYGIF
jgi:UDP-glucose 4-epimerase